MSDGSRPLREVLVSAVDDIPDPGSREFAIGEGEWPFRGFVIRVGADVFAYQNRCPHAGHPLNWAPHRFLTKDESLIICGSHGAVFERETGLCVDGPCVGRSLTAVPVTIREGKVFVHGPDGLR